MTFTCSCGLRIEIPEPSSRAQLRDLLYDHRLCARRAQRKEATAGYEEGWKAGYAKGMDAGTDIGYSDAKLRAHLAIDALDREMVRAERSIAPKEVGRRVADVINALVGARS